MLPKHLISQIQYIIGVALLCALCATAMVHYVGHKWLIDGLDLIEIGYYPMLYGLNLFFMPILIGSMLLSMLRVTAFRQKQTVLHWSAVALLMAIFLLLFCLIFDYTIYYLYPNLPRTYATEYEANENAHGRLVSGIGDLLTQPMFRQYLFQNTMMAFGGGIATSLTAHFSIKRNKNVV